MLSGGPELTTGQDDGAKRRGDRRGGRRATADRMNASPSGVDPLPAGPDGLICAARGCRKPASYDLQWNNPKIHTPGPAKALAGLR